MSLPVARNVWGQPLVACSFEPLTGYFRDGCCKTVESDTGTHVVCARMTQAFLDFSLARGNDLSTPRPQWRFPGLVAGDQWCVCANRWLEALAAGVAPPVILESTNQTVLKLVDLEVLRQFEHRAEETD